MRHAAFADELTRDDLIAWYRTTRDRTRSLFDLVKPEAYYDRPISLRNPIVFYEGHLPAFCVNTLVKLTYGRKGIDDRLETLFARGIDPEDETAVKSPTELWPSREEVQAYAKAADALVEETLAEPDEATFTILEHELMHQETLLYILHQLPYEKKHTPSPPSAAPLVSATRRLDDSVRIPAGRAILGGDPGTFGWDNEFPSMTVEVPEFTIDAHNVTNGTYLEYMNATGSSAPHFWVRGEHEWYRRGLFELAPLPLDAPVYVTHDEAAVYARWRGKRLPTEAEYDRARGGEGEGNFGFRHWDPVPAGSYTPNAAGIYDLVGNGWEWTSTIFDGFPGFLPMASYREYSADFFDGAHYVLKGASPVTARELIRPSFRNWFRPAYPYVYATFRCAH